jgi:hypothetical protein
MAGQKQTRHDSGKLHVQGPIAQLPGRPDCTVLSDSIPLFFIGRNQSGFWVARESEGRSGGLFLFRWSAARFARKQSSPRGCATMLVEHTIELDLPTGATGLGLSLQQSTSKGVACIATNLHGICDRLR